MKKLLLLGALVGLCGFSYSFADYIQIGWNKVSEGLKDSVPVGIEIDRLGLSLQQLDAEIASNAHKVVEESVALDRFAKLVEEKQQGLATLKSDLSLLKNKYVSTTCDKTKGTLEKSMLTRVTRFKSQSEAVASMEKALNHKRDAFEKMRAAFEKQKLTRDVLKNRLDSLKAEYQSLKMQGSLAQSELTNSAVRKATDLALEIEDRLEVQRRLAEQTEELVTDGDLDEHLESKEAAFDLSDVNGVLDETLEKLAQ